MAKRVTKKITKKAVKKGPVSFHSIEAEKELIRARMPQTEVPIVEFGVKKGKIRASKKKLKGSFSPPTHKIVFSTEGTKVTVPFTDVEVATAILANFNARRAVSETAVINALACINGYTQAQATREFRKIEKYNNKYFPFFLREEGRWGTTLSAARFTRFWVSDRTAIKNLMQRYNYESPGSTFTKEQAQKELAEVKKLRSRLLIQTGITNAELMRVLRAENRSLPSPLPQDTKKPRRPSVKEAPANLSFDWLMKNTKLAEPETNNRPVTNVAPVPISEPVVKAKFDGVELSPNEVRAIRNMLKAWKDLQVHIGAISACVQAALSEV